MLEQVTLFLAGGPAEDLEAAVDLNRVAVHSGRVLAALAEPLGDGDRHAGLSDRRGTEQREDLHTPSRT